MKMIKWGGSIAVAMMSFVSIAGHMTNGGGYLFFLQSIDWN